MDLARIKKIAWYSSGQMISDATAESISNSLNAEFAEDQPQMIEPAIVSVDHSEQLDRIESDVLHILNVLEALGAPKETVKAAAK